MPKSEIVFKDYLKNFSDHGLLDRERNLDDLQNENIRIYPVISELLSGDMIERIAPYINAELPEEGDKQEEDL